MAQTGDGRSRHSVHYTHDHPKPSGIPHDVPTTGIPVNPLPTVSGIPTHPAPTYTGVHPHEMYPKGEEPN